MTVDHRPRQAERAGYPPAQRPMAEPDYSDYPIYPPVPVGRAQKMARLAGAGASVALVATLIWWGWDLAMRDIRGVPVVRALEGPMRIAPEDPGGAVVDHQGLAVNDVAAQGGVAAPPDRLVLAPGPVELAEGDVAGLSGDALAAAPPEGAADRPVLPDGTVSDLDEPPQPEVVATAPTDLPAADLVPVIEGGQEDAVAAALAMALEGGIDTDADTGDSIETVTMDDAGNPPPPGAVTRSPRPPPRPGAAAAAAAAGPATGTNMAAVAPVAVDPATLAPGTRLVQFGAYDSAAQAEQAWTMIAQQFGDLMAGKGMVIQTAESGGRNFFRLRATGFPTEQDSRRFCAALEAENVKCIPVAHR